MKRAKERVLVLLILACIAFGASIAASFRYPSGWMILLAFSVGFACAWMLFGSLVAYGQLRAATRLLKKKQALAVLAAAIQKGQPASIATPATAPEGTAP